MIASSVNTIPVNPYYAATAKAAAARRPFQLRKKPLKRAASVQAWAGSKMAFMTGQWMNAGREQTANDFQYPAGVGKDADFG
jgi:hypothetical protein